MATLDVFQELSDHQREIERRVERLEFTLRIKRRQSRRPRPYEDWMPDFIAALRENDGVVSNALSSCHRRNKSTPSLQTIYARRKACGQFRDEWLEVVMELKDSLEDNLASLNRSLELVRAEHRDAERLENLVRTTKARLGMIERSLTTLSKESSA